MTCDPEFHDSDLRGLPMTCGAAKPSKYRSVKTAVDGIIFASAREAKRYGELKLLERAKQINDLNLQVPFMIIIKGKLVCNYFADFVYLEKGQRIIEDVKGVRTPLYRLKKKLVEAQFGIVIREIT